MAARQPRELVVVIAAQKRSRSRVAESKRETQPARAVRAGAAPR